MIGSHLDDWRELTPPLFSIRLKGGSIPAPIGRIRWFRGTPQTNRSMRTSRRPRGDGIDRRIKKRVRVVRGLIHWCARVDLIPPSNLTIFRTQQLLSILSPVLRKIETTLHLPVPTGRPGPEELLFSQHSNGERQRQHLLSNLIKIIRFDAKIRSCESHHTAVFNPHVNFLAKMVFCP